jgi:hypothetical protein
MGTISDIVGWLGRLGRLGKPKRVIHKRKAVIKSVYLSSDTYKGWCQADWHKWLAEKQFDLNNRVTYSPAKFGVTVKQWNVCPTKPKKLRRKR